MEELKIWKDDPYLEPYKKTIWGRYLKALIRYREISGYGNLLYSSVNNHLYYGIHSEGDELVFREWAPRATELYLICNKNGWAKDEHYRFSKLDSGNWELRLHKSELSHGNIFKWLVVWNGGEGERLPAYATRCIQDPITKIFSAQLWMPQPYSWKNKRPKRVENPLIYEAHIGMSSEECVTATYSHFRTNILPRIVEAGYNTIQLMAIQEHPYYGSFGYQVANFFAPSSRFGTPEELKMLIDEAHGLGLSVILDIVHSHSVNNVAEGLSMFDGSEDLYFHAGDRGQHPAWTSRCFDYGKTEVIHFLLSNCKYWLEEYNFDGFRFDGITSMIYYDHGLGKSFTDYSCYYDGNQDEDALVYLTLANCLIKETYRDAITIAEDVSGLPGLAAPFENGGVGFDFRMSMGVSDNWIKWIKELPDEKWHMGDIFYELTNKRVDERTISYAECHDQAMVGDKTIIFRLIDSEMYTSMSKFIESLVVDRGVALHKMIRLVTISTAGDGYLNFMGNEFGHPEWIDFPREGNGWSYYYARRQWSLAEDENLKYSWLLKFDRSMIKLVKKERILEYPVKSLFIDNQKQILIYSRRDLIFVFSFNPTESFTDYKFKAPAGKYKYVLDSDDKLYGGFSRNNHAIEHFTIHEEEGDKLSLYIPSRSAFVLKKQK